MTVQLSQGASVGHWTLRSLFREGGRTFWRCICTCGAEVNVLSDNLSRGRSRSCGCVRDAATGARSRLHGQSRSALYGVWRTMVDRCSNPANTQYRDYGGRGVQVHLAWGTFEGFLMDNPTHPGGGLTFDRINNDGNYEPGNVRWATRGMQARNRRGNRQITVNGVTACLQDWALSAGVTANHLYRRMRRGMTPEQALQDVLANPPKVRGPYTKCPAQP